MKHKNILFICHGNICRSPVAEFVFKKMVNDAGLQDAFNIESAATSREEIGNDIYPPAKRSMDAHGILYERRAARQITTADYDKFDYIVVMDERNISNAKKIVGEDSKAKISKLLGWAGINRDIADPWYTGDFEQSYSDIVQGCEALLEKLKNE